MGSGIEVSPDMDPSEALAHYGVKGMRWGHRKPEDSGSGSSKPSRSERRAMDKAAKREDNLKLTKFHQKAQTKNDQAILDARARVNRVQQEYKDAKSVYKVQKQEIGKVAAKRALKEAGHRRAETIAKASELTKEESRIYNIMLFGEAVGALFTGNPSSIGTDSISDYQRKLDAIRTVEREHRRAAARR